MPKNPYVRIALVIVLVILLYYLVVTLGRGTAAADDSRVPPAGAERIEDIEPTRTGILEPRLREPRLREPRFWEPR